MHDRRLLDLYLDGDLDSNRRLEVTDHLIGCPHCADYVTSGEALRSSARTRLRSVQPPSDLIDSIRATIMSTSPPPTARRSLRARRLLPAAAVLAVLAIGAVLILQVIDRQDSPALDLTTELAAAYATFAHDNSLLEVTGDRATVLTWFRERIDFESSVPDLPGYELRGGRVVMLDGQPAAMVVYENEPAQEYVSILTFAAPFGDLDSVQRSGDFRVRAIGDVAVAIWSDGDLYHALVGTVSRADVVRLATEAARET